MADAVDRVSGYEGDLPHWKEVASARDWDALLVGNGLSINVWADFAYESLFDQAKASDLLTPADTGLFAEFSTENFEEVLAALSTAIRVGDALDRDRAEELARHASIREALARSVQDAHVLRPDIPDEPLAAIKGELRRYRAVFTTSYDLLLYWAVAHDDKFAGFLDFFWAMGKLAFDESSITVDPTDGRTRLFFLHGALHIVVLGDGTTCKRRAADRSLLEQFGDPHLGDPAARPLVITEARAEDKARRVGGNPYLSYCWRELAQSEAPLVIFGHSLSGQDAHLIEALNERPERPIAFGLRSQRRTAETKKEQHRIHSLLESTELVFFDSGTHPLGDKKLALGRLPWYRLTRRMRSFG